MTQHTNPAQPQIEQRAAGFSPRDSCSGRRACRTTADAGIGRYTNTLEGQDNKNK